MKYSDIAAVVLAAGEGKRMQSETPKVLHEITGKPLLYYSLSTLQSLGFGQIITVGKYKYEAVETYVSDNFPSDVVLQGSEYGTAKALETALPSLKPEIKDCIVLYADNSMFVSQSTYQKLLAAHRQNENAITFATREVEDPKKMGRIVRDQHGDVAGIIETKDARENELQIKEVNPGLYVFNRLWLEANVSHITLSPITGEYYITDLIGVAINQNQKVQALNFGHTDEWQSVTAPEDIETIESWLKGKHASEIVHG